MPPPDEEGETTWQWNYTQQSNRSWERGGKMVVETVMMVMTTMTTIDDDDSREQTLPQTEWRTRTNICRQPQ